MVFTLNKIITSFLCIVFLFSKKVETTLFVLAVLLMVEPVEVVEVSRVS